MSDLVLILYLLYCWLSGGSTLVFGPAGEKPKNSTVKLGSKKFKIFQKNLIFFHFFDSHDCMKMLLNT